MKAFFTEAQFGNHGFAAAGRPRRSFKEAVDQVEYSRVHGPMRNLEWRVKDQDGKVLKSWRALNDYPLAETIR